MRIRKPAEAGFLLTKLKKNHAIDLIVALALLAFLLVITLPVCRYLIPGLLLQDPVR